MRGNLPLLAATRSAIVPSRPGLGVGLPRMSPDRCRKFVRVRSSWGVSSLIRRSSWAASGLLDADELSVPSVLPNGGVGICARVGLSLTTGLLLDSPVPLVEPDATILGGVSPGEGMTGRRALLAAAWFSAR